MTTRLFSHPTYFSAAAAPLVAAALMLAATGGCDKKKNDAAAPDAPAAAAPDSPATPASPSSNDGGPAPAVSGNPKEISANPAVLHDASVPPQQFELHGVKLGDPVAAIPQADITRGPDDSGLVDFRGKTNVFRIDNEKVASLHFNDAATLAKLGIQTDADLVKRFGQPDAPVEVNAGDPQASYSFKSRWLAVLFSPRDKRVIAVTVNAE